MTQTVAYQVWQLHDLRRNSPRLNIGLIDRRAKLLAAEAHPIAGLGRISSRNSGEKYCRA